MSQRPPITPCQLLAETRDAIVAYAEALKTAAPSIGTHGLSPQEFWDSGLFQSAIERLRGQQAASMAIKREFVRGILDHLQAGGHISRWTSSGSADRHDYEVVLPDQTVVAIEAKGCLDGNNTNIFVRPPNADEFYIWSLCQNPGADPRHNAWSGIHTRLSAEIMARGERVDGLIIWDMLCGTVGRACPKVADAGRLTAVGARQVPPPCLYLFPRSIPDPRNNPAPRCWRLEDLKFLRALHGVFHGDSGDVTEVRIEADMEGADVRRRTRLVRDSVEVVVSDATPIQRAGR
jgi:hypothetical protein